MRMGCRRGAGSRGYRGGARVHATAHVMLNPQLCRACWACVNVCPKGVLGKVAFPFHKHVRIVRATDCAGCLACVKKCPEGAIRAIKD